MSTSFDGPLPGPLAHLASWSWQRITLGQSDAAVWRLHKKDDVLILKSAPAHPLSEMPGEIARLQWLAGTDVPAPVIKDAFDAEGLHWLLMTALPGQDLTEMVDRPDAVVHILAESLKALHALDIATCPFDHRLENRLATGTRHVAAGLVDEDDFDEAHVGWTAQSVLDWLLTNRPQTHNRVVTHGDASLPNIMGNQGAFSGVIDCGRVGIADPWQDLTIACRSLEFNCGKAHVGKFLAAYGADWDEERYRYYNALDELF